MTMASEVHDEVFSYDLKIPKERIAVLIGTAGKEKVKLEKQTKTKISVDSREVDVVVQGKDALLLFACKEMIRAIARGFNPDLAKQLLKPDYGLEVLNINDFAKTKNDIIRLKGRLIGAQGKSRGVIEDLSGANISVYGKTVAVIGDVDGLHMAHRAVEMLLQGSPHRNVYKWLEKHKKNLIQRRWIE